MGTLLITVAAISFTACKKEDATPQPKTPMEKIAGKWKLESTISNGMLGGFPYNMTYTGTAADYADFRNDGKVYSFMNGTYDTSSYGVFSNTKMWIEQATDTFDIQVLTDIQFKVYRKEIYGGGDYYEATTTLKK